MSNTHAICRYVITHINTQVSYIQLFLSYTYTYLLLSELEVEYAPVLPNTVDMGGLGDDCTPALETPSEDNLYGYIYDCIGMYRCL